MKQGKAIKLKTVGGKKYAYVKDLKINPFNPAVYADTNEERSKIQEIADTYSKRVSKKQCPNSQPILIWKDGLIEAGNTRQAAANRAGIDMVWVEYSEEPYPNPDKPYETFTTITGSNLYRKMTWSIKLNEFNMMNDAYEKEFGTKRPTSIQNEHIKRLETSKATLDKLNTILIEKPSLLKLIDDDVITIKAAYDEATGKTGVKVKTSQNLNYDWDGIYTDFLFKKLMTRVSSYMTRMYGLEVKVGDENYNPLYDFEPARIAGIVSDAIMTIGGALLRADGHDVVTAKGHWSDPDIFHKDIDDRVEIKVATFKGNQTQWQGGQGIREGKYILATYNEDMDRWFVCFTNLMKEDWKKVGPAGHTVSVQTILKNHKKDMRIIYGDLYANKNNVQLNLDKL
jgi:hypothetical protein